MKSNHTRDVDELLIKKCQDSKVFGLFVDFVKKTDDLELCFRGNDSEIGTIIIYRHNHMMWKLETDRNGKSPKVGISMNHCRFMSDWDDYAVRELMRIGFKPTNTTYRNETYEQLKCLENKTGQHIIAKENKEGSCSVMNLKYYIDTKKETEEHLREVIHRSYVVLCRMHNEYFNPLEMNMVKVPNDDHTDIKPKPINFVKAYCRGYSTEQTYNAVIEDLKKPKDERERLYANLQSCVEKHVQQELFRLNHKLSDGLFIYDLEFTEPSEKTGDSKKIIESDEDYEYEEDDDNENSQALKSNKPDMFAIRYDENDKPVAISLVEVKSTESAFIGKSGVKEHLEGMIRYVSKKYNDGTYAMNKRREEAALIMEQYRQLGLCELSGHTKIDKNAYMNLPVEIIFIFSNGYNMQSKIKNCCIKDMIAPVLQKYSVEDKEINGFFIKKAEDYSLKISFDIKCPPISAYRYEIVMCEKADCANI